MHIKTALFLLMAGVAFSVQGQEKGYFRKRTMIELGGMGQLPVFQNIFGQDKGFVEKNGILQSSYNLPDVSFRIGIATIAQEKKAYGIEVAQRYYAVNPVKDGEINRQYTNSSGVLQSEFMRAKAAYIPVQELVIMPKVLFSNLSGRVPVGLTQEFGIGYSLIHVKNYHPMVEVDSLTAAYSASEIQNQFVDNRVEELKGLVFMYGIRMNYPITKSLLFNIGFRYQYDHLLKKKSFRNYEQTEYWLSGRELWSRINQRRQLGIINFGMGFVVCF